MAFVVLSILCFATLLVVAFWSLVVTGPVLILVQVVLQGWHRWYMGHDALSVLQLLRIQLHETWSWSVIWSWHLTWFLESGRPEGERVLAVHGYTQNTTNWTGLRRKLNARGHSCEAVFLGFPWPWRRIEGYARPLEHRLEDLAAAAEHTDIVAHSMGGLVLREILSRREDLRHVIGKVVTLGTPHHGTAAARVSLFHPTPQIRHRSPWISALPALTEMLTPEQVTTLGSRADLIVYPESTTRQPGAEHYTFDDIGHGGLLVDDAVLEAVAQTLSR